MGRLYLRRHRKDAPPADTSIQAQRIYSLPDNPDIPIVKHKMVTNETDAPAGKTDIVPKLR